MVRSLRLLAFMALTSLAAGQQPDVLTHSIPPPGTGAQGGANLGNSVAVDGIYTVVGAPLDDIQADNSGVVKVFHSTTGELLHVILNPSPSSSDGFGYSVAISGTRVVVGAYSDDTGTVNTGSAYVYDLSSGTPTVPVTTLNNPNPAFNDFFGYSVGISGTHVVVGAFLDDAGATDAGSAYVYDVGSGTPTVPVATLNNPGPAVSDYFGHSVAISGTRVVVGAYQDDAGATDAGSAYVYDVSGGTPSVPVATLNNPGPAVSDYFGYSVGISGTRVVVGAIQDDTGASNAGSAYVYDVSSGTPTVPVHTLNNPSPAIGDIFGNSVAISGTRVVVGAKQDDTGANNAGSAYVYDLSGGTPTVPVHTINNTTPAADDQFGQSVATDSNRVVVGAYWDDKGASNAGSAYVYDVSSGTPTVPVATLNNPGPAVNDQFGWSVAMEGTLMLVGAPLEDTGAVDAGSVYVYDLSSSTPTVPVHTINNPSPVAADKFGHSVAISGTRVVVGVIWYDDGPVLPSSGRAYVYDLGSGTPTVPVHTLNNPSQASGDNFGQSVGISGTRVVVAAPQDDTGASNAGSAYVYDVSSGTPTVPVHTLNNPGPAADDQFGTSVGISGTRVVVGAFVDDTGATNAGSAYVYDVSSGTPTVPVHTLNNPSPAVSDFFGLSVGISGTRVVVGAPSDSTGALNAGSAYVYDVSSGTPTVPLATLNNPAPASSDQLGCSVAISGTRVVVGAYQDDTGATNAGSVYVYDMNVGTPTVPVATFSNPSPAVLDLFGNSVAISGTRVVVGAYLDDTVAADRGYAYVYGPTVSHDASLSALTLSPGTLSPVFSTGTTSYSATVSSTTTEVAVTPTTTDANATVVVTGNSSLVTGSNTVSVTVTAQDGTTTQTYTIHVTRNTLPTLNLPDSPLVVEASSALGRTVTFTATASDAEDGSLTAMASPASGSLFGLGDTTVEVSATDSFGETSTGSFVVRVRDTTPPTLQAPVGGFAPLEVLPMSPLPDYAAQAVSYDTVGSITVVQTPAAGTTYIGGPLAVTLVATDTAGNPSTVLTINVSQANRAPVATDDVVTFSGATTNFNPLLNDSDPDNDTLTIIDVGDPSTGSVTFTGNSITYTKDGATFDDQDGFTYTVSDGKGGEDTAAVIVASYNSLAGTYTGLLDDGTGHADGIFRATVTVSGNLTGRAVMNGRVFGLSGRLDSTGADALVSAGATFDVQMKMANTVPGETRQHLSVVAVETGVTFTGNAIIHAYSSPSPVSALGVGYYHTAQMAQTGQTGLPASPGWMRMLVAKSGAVTISGRGPDTLPVSCATAIVVGGQVMVYANGLQSNPKTEHAGVLNLTLGGAVTGVMKFNKLPQATAKGALHGTGFSGNYDTVGGKFIKPAAGTRLLTTNGAGQVQATMTGGGHAAPTTKTLTLSVAHAFTPLPSAPLTLLRINTSGQITGTVKSPTNTNMAITGLAVPGLSGTAAVQAIGCYLYTKDAYEGGEIRVIAAP